MDCDDGSLEAVGDEAFIAIANELLDKCNLPGKVTRLEECSDNFFVGVYKGLLGDDLQGIIENPISAEQHIRNCQTVINLIASDVLNVDLSHISGKAIVEGDKISIRNFLEIFAGLLEYFMEYVNDEGSDEDDSNLLTSEHDVISGVLREEFGPSYDVLYGPRPQTSRPSQFRDDTQLSREMSQLPSAAGSLGPKRNAQGRRAGAADFVAWDAGNSTGFDADTSKLSDTRADVVRDSTAELIRLGETTLNRVPSKSPERKETSDHFPDSTSAMSAPTPLITGTSQEASRVLSDDAAGGIMDGQRSGQGTGREVLGDTVLSQRSESARNGPLEYTTRKTGTSSLLSRDATSIEDELTQYTLTPTELTDSSASKDKGDDKPSTSYLSTSSTSAAWPEQISPLEPSKDSTGRETSGFDALGVRPREQAVTSEVTDVRSGNSSGRSTPVYHHYHHHFHHTQPQERVPGFQSVAAVSAATTVDVPSGPASHLSRSEPSEAATKPGSGLAERLTKTAPAAFTYPLTGDTYPSAAVPRSISTVSSTGFTQPPLATVRGTTSTLTDSVFLSASGSSRPSVVGANSAAVTSDAFGGTASLRERLARPLITTSATSSAVSSTVLSTSRRPHGAAWGSLADRKSKPEQSDGTADRLSRLKRRQPLVSTLPARLQTRITDVEHPPVHRSTVDEELLARYPSKEAEESEDSESEREYEDEDLAQNSDSAVDYRRIGPTTTRMTGDTSTSRPSSRAERSTKGPRTPHSYKESTEEDSSPEHLARRGVKFRDTVETFPVSGRMDRLRRLLYEEAEEQRKRHTKSIRKTYRDQLKELQQEKEREKTAQHKRKLPLSPGVPKKKPKKKSPVKKRGRLEAVYSSQNRKSRPRKIASTVKGRKRSASASPVLSRRRSDSLDHPEVLLPAMLEEFPFLHVSPQTAHSMWNKQARHLSSVLKSGAEAKKTKTQRMIEDAEKRQEALVGILKKDLDHNLRMREKQERQQQQRTVKAKLREKRQVSARARRYYDEYELRMRARMLKRRTREEQIFKRLFEDGLDIQKQRIRELREYAKEKREALAQKQQNEIESLENFYRDQFALLAEGIARERYEMEVREKAQEKVVRQMRGDLRKKLERDVREFQENLQRDEDSAYFRQLEADRLRTKFQLATRSAFY